MTPEDVFRLGEISVSYGMWEPDDTVPPDYVGNWEPYVEGFPMQMRLRPVASRYCRRRYETARYGNLTAGRWEWEYRYS